MPAHVFREEVLVENGAEQQAPEQTHVRLRPVDELVRYHDTRDGGVCTDQHHGDEAVGGPQALDAEQVHEEPDVQELERDEHVQHDVEGSGRRVQHRFMAGRIAARASRRAGPATAAAAAPCAR